MVGLGHEEVALDVQNGHVGFAGEVEGPTLYSRGRVEAQVAKLTRVARYIYIHGYTLYATLFFLPPLSAFSLLPVTLTSHNSSVAPAVVPGVVGTQGVPDGVADPALVEGGSRREVQGGLDGWWVSGLGLGLRRCRFPVLLLLRCRVDDTAARVVVGRGGCFLRTG